MWSRRIKRVGVGLGLVVGLTLVGHAQVRLRFVVPPVAVSGTPDPTQLSSDTTTNENVSAWTALNVGSLAVGGSYVDPVTGVTIVRITSSTAPISGTSVLSSGPDYGSGGNRFSRPESGVYKLRTQRYVSGPTASNHILTFNINTHAVAYHSVIPGDNLDLRSAFSYVDPDIIYVVDGNVLRKYNVDTTTPVQVTGGVWPKTLTAGSYNHFQVSADDRWFSVQNTGQTLIRVWDSQTDTVTSRNITMNEHKMDPDGAFIAVVLNSGAGIEHWDVVANTLTGVVSGATGSGHVACAHSYCFSVNGDTDGKIWRTDVTDVTSPVAARPSSPLRIYSIYVSGNWVDQSNTTAQWGVMANQPYTGCPACETDETIEAGGIALIKMDGTDQRLVAHSYGQGDIDSGYETDSIWPNISPDGRLIWFKSNLRNQGGFASSFMIIMPTTP